MSESETEERYRGFVVHCRGLPWETTDKDIVKFFDDVEIVEGGVNVVRDDKGQIIGDCFVEFASEDDLKNALKKNKQYMGTRYIEVFKTTKGERDWALKKIKVGAVNAESTMKASQIVRDTLKDTVVRLRGLPYQSTNADVEKFFKGLEIAPNGISFVLNERGKTGEAFVQFATAEAASKSLERHKKHIGERYIEVFPSTMTDARSHLGIGPPSQRSRNFGGGPSGGRYSGGGPLGRSGLMSSMGSSRSSPYDRLSAPRDYRDTSSSSSRVGELSHGVLDRLDLPTIENPMVELKS